MAKDTREDAGQYYPGGKVVPTRPITPGGPTSVSWDDVTGKPTAFNPSTHASTHAAGGTDAITPAAIGAATATHASTHAANGADAITPAAIGAVTASDISDAVVVHDGSSSAHSELLAAKADKPASPTSGNFAGLDANGNLTDSGKKAADFVQFEADDDPESGEKTAVTIGSRSPGSVGLESFVDGQYCEASGECSHAEGNATKASGYVSHAEGINSTASGDFCHAEGSYTTASADAAHAEGCYTTASGFYAHAEGSRSTSSGEATHAEGYGSVASHQTAFVWQGAPNSKNIADEPTEGEKYNDHGAGTFNINPVGGTDGFYIGSQNLSTLLAAYLRDNTAAYSSSAAYAVGAFCRYNGALYVCNTAIAAPGEAWTAAHWTAMPNVASLFSGDNTSLNATIGSKLVLYNFDTSVIPNDVYRSATGIQEIEVCQDHIITEIGVRSFAGLPNLRVVHKLPNIVTIKAHAFEYCTKLAEVEEIGSTLVTMGNRAFANCPRLGKITIRGNLSGVNFDSRWCRYAGSEIGPEHTITLNLHFPDATMDQVLVRTYWHGQTSSDSSYYDQIKATCSDGYITWDDDDRIWMKHQS